MLEEKETPERERLLRGSSRALVLAALRAAREIKAKAVLIAADTVPDLSPLERGKNPVPVFFARRRQEITTPESPQESAVSDHAFFIPDIPLSRVGQIKVMVILAISANLLTRGDKIVCVSGSPGGDSLDTLALIEVGKAYETLSSSDIVSLTGQVEPQIFEALFRLSIEIAREGRDGRPVGTVFVLGDTDNVIAHARQMILNPFKGYTEKERQILNPQVRETLKELSQIDGAFIIRPNGVVQTGGTFLEAKLVETDLPRGLGSRHLSAAAITGVTESTAIAISQSTGHVRIFRGGHLILEVERMV